jgi:hypothetical protein
VQCDLKEQPGEVVELKSLPTSVLRGRSKRETPETAHRRQKIIGKLEAEPPSLLDIVIALVIAVVDKRPTAARGYKSDVIAAIVLRPKLVPRTIAEDSRCVPWL